MHIKYICQAYINKTTYKYGRLGYELVIITALFLPVFRIHETLARIHILRSWIHKKFANFLHKILVLECKQIPKYILPCQTFYFVIQKFREIS
jgi:hypothetical protein